MFWSFPGLLLLGEFWRFYHRRLPLRYSITSGLKLLNLSADCGGLIAAAGFPCSAFRSASRVIWRSVTGWRNIDCAIAAQYNTRIPPRRPGGISRIRLFGLEFKPPLVKAAGTRSVISPPATSLIPRSGVITTIWWVALLLVVPNTVLCINTPAADILTQGH